MDEAMMQNDSRNQFLSWLDNTFTDGDPTAPFSSKIDPSGGKKSYRKSLWDSNGDWLENEPESAKALNKLLCRPLKHLWQVGGRGGAHMIYSDGALVAMMLTLSLSRAAANEDG